MQVNEIIISKSGTGIIEFQLGGEKINIILGQVQTEVLKRFCQMQLEHIAIDTLPDTKGTVITFTK
jgi:hypothetical protein